jgi:ribosomal protein S13
MKFEHLLKVYWSKNFLYGGRVLPFNVTLKTLFKNLKGLSSIGKKNFIKRFELNTHAKDNRENLNKLTLDNRKVMNMYLARLTSINNSITELVRYNLIRLYLLKTFRGRAQSIGKPSRGQRT